MAFSDQLKNALSSARSEAARLHHDSVRPEHLALGLLHAEGTLARAVLVAAGLTVEGTRAALGGPRNGGRDATGS